LDSPKNDPASHSGLYSELGGSTWVGGSGRPAGVNLPARVSFTGDEVSRGSRGKGRGDAAEGGRRGLPLAALSARRAAAGSLQESVGDGERELVPKELFLLSFGSCLGQREGEEVWGKRERGVEEEEEGEPVLFCCIRQWILNQLDRLPYLTIDTVFKRLRNLHVRYTSTFYCLILVENKTNYCLGRTSAGKKTF
jgi:hypothetical protein